MTRSVSILVLVLFVGLSHAQTPEYLELVKAENRLQELFSQLYSDSLSEVESVLAIIQELMPGILETEGAMEFPWSKLDRIGVITSDDGQVRIFTWHVADDPDNYRYFGYIQVALKKGKVNVYELVDNQKQQRNRRKLEQSTDDWYGKLYYRIITLKYKRKVYYTLLGMDFNNVQSNIKTIEAMVIQRNQPEFAGDLFFDGKDRVDRMVLEYSSQVAISVRYEPSVDMITFDHLVPFHPIYNGNYEFYGPDGSFDGLEFSSGTWIFREDIDVRNLD
ncbi:MAG: hypothetical protein KAR19_19660 [Bacteroidales bacterium]|nr:hypothetical protein [Bacteroidales bacterium]